MTRALRRDWKAGEPGHDLEHNEISQRLATVKDYGAKGDGTTDDRAAFEAALATGHVRIPAGTYLLTKAAAGAYCLPVPSNTIIEAQPGAVLKLTDGQPAWTRILALINTENVVIRGLELDGNRANQTADEHRHGVYMQAAVNVTIERCHFHDFTGDGISLFTGVWDVAIRDCHIHDCDRDGIALTGSGGRVTVENCHIHDITAQPVDSEPEVSGYDDVRIRNCTIVARDDQYAVTTGGHDATTLNRDWVIDGNTITGAIDVIRCDGLKLVNNTIRAATNTLGAITGRYKALRVTVANNVIEGGSVPVVSVVMAEGEIPDRWRIEGNTISATGMTSGMLLQGISSAIVRGNSIRGAGAGYGLNVYATSPLESLIAGDNHISGVENGVYLAAYQQNNLKRVLIGGNILQATARGIWSASAAERYETVVTDGNIIDAPTPIVGP